MSNCYMDKKFQKKLNKQITKIETVEEFLARGGTIQKTVINKKKQKVDAQALLDAAVGTKHEEEVIKALKANGIRVE